MEEQIEEFHAAVRRNDAESVRRLLFCRQPDEPRFPVDDLGEDGETALLRAARIGQPELCSALLDGGADPLVRDANPEYFSDGVWPDERRPDARRRTQPPAPGALSGRTAIYHLRLARCFDKVLASIFPTTRLRLVRTVTSAISSYHRSSALIAAAKLGYLELAALVLTHTSCAGPPQPGTGSMASSAPSLSFWSTAQGGTAMFNERAAALLVAATHKQWRVAEVILAAGVADVSMDSTRDPSGRTVVHIAAAAGEVKTLRLLLKAGATTSIFSGYGRQPLHDACVVGHTAVARVLTERGADPLARVKRGSHGIPWRESDVGKTALELAEQYNRIEVAAYLRGSEQTRGLPIGGQAYP